MSSVPSFLPCGGRRGGGRGGEQPTQIHKFDLLAIDRRNGSILWQRTAREELPHEGTHLTRSWASHSPVTDGEHVYAYFGSRGLYCFDMQGNLKWEKDLGNMAIKMGFGEGSSPALYGEVVIVNWDHEGDSFITALDKKTGEERWRVERDERTSWSTPIVVEHNGRGQVITSATHRIRSYDLATGNLLWECGGMTDNTIPSPVTADGMVYVTSGFRGNALQAIRLAAASGDITGSEAIVWEYNRDTPYVPSPLLYGDALYFLKSNNGILSCFNAKTGEAYYGPQRLDGIREVYASPVGASNRVYIADRDGATLVIQHGPEFKVLAQNVLDDGFDASPAIVGNEIYLRGRKYLYCIASD
ncbi:PQQ-like beta-propeller repeat protein [Candidatus Poribacteria bacterium]|nr:PQQ-like beta-propeller repeat protein [Candidatus Poribacteria bacterium]